MQNARQIVRKGHHVKKATPFLRAVGIAASVLLVGAMTGAATVGAQTSRTAGGSAYGVQLEGPIPISATPTVEASVTGAGEETAEDSLIHVPAAPLAESFTALVQAGGSGMGELEAILQAIVEEAAAGEVPTGWNGRGYAITEDLLALAETLEADVVESESLAGCVDGEVVYGSASRVVNLVLGGTQVPIPLNPDPNTVLFDQAGIRIVLWETNWDPETGGTTDGEATVWTNALHVTAPGGVDLIVSHSEAFADCGPVPPPPPPSPPPPDGPPEAPPPTPIEDVPTFTG